MTPKQIDKDYDRVSDSHAIGKHNDDNCNLHIAHLRVLSELLNNYWTQSDLVAVHAALLRFDCPANWSTVPDFIGTHAWASRLSNVLVKTDRMIEAGRLWSELARNRTVKYAKRVANEYCRIASTLRGAKLLSTYDTVLGCIVCAEAAVAQLAAYVEDTQDVVLKKSLATLTSSLAKIRAMTIPTG